MNDGVIESYDEDAEANSCDETKILMKKATYEIQKFYILLTILLITIALLIAISIYSYLIKY